ncbi:MAG: transcription termination factor NusA [Deltaproteobacteria bacterium]|jgi:transcription termination/antitermination protein NusA|nr:transcription termination factor NusA [Deltaproteobacteria bacterium]MBT4267248.1 transcription termination factor NusA [Deltaproteobacteria bacterium]MBT4639340.1 transcription termination factor NusA [Deltaproteobacteria bacterium]MBT6504656.1 transcription termination factor NusA [Deltaproteobacteria bacterium]MBT6611517.1 transcription termination factor NusA [Deltaproteobacteria bacterium]
MKPGGLLEAIMELSHERGLDQDAIVEAIEDAIVGAAYRKYKNYKNIEAELNLQTGEIDLMHYKVVVDQVKDADNEILLDEVIKLDPLAESGDEVEYEIDSNEFKNVIAQTARQLIFQKIREAERESVIEKYAEKKGEIIHGTVSRIERGRVIITIGNAVEAALEYREQIPFEKLQAGENVRLLLIDLLSDGRGPQLIVSRTHPNFLIKLFEVEVPEVYDGIIEVVAAAREPGKRAKVAVYTNDSDIDPVGACVGMRGSRVQSIVSELCGERIDVIEWSESLEQFIANSLAPAEIIEIDLDEENGSANIKIAQDQLSLAIGKQGQNVRLASKLTGIMININPWEPERELTSEENISDKTDENLAADNNSETDAAVDVAEKGNEAIDPGKTKNVAEAEDAAEKGNEAIDPGKAEDVAEKGNESIDPGKAGEAAIIPPTDADAVEAAPGEASEDKPVEVAAETVVEDGNETPVVVDTEVESQKKIDAENVEVAEPPADVADGKPNLDKEI